MRLIGALPQESDARAFSQYLIAQGIANQIEADDGSWSVWVHREDQVQEGRRHLQACTAGHLREQMEQAASEARRVQRAEEDRRRRARANHVDVGGQWRGEVMLSRRIGLVTLLLIAASVAVAVASRLGTNERVLQPLVMSEQQPTADGGFTYVKGLPEVRRGQLWRLLTPMFIHFGFIHILFNMLWLKDLGGMIEHRQGSLVLALLVVATSLATNLAQYAWAGPMFGGMSGVVYGLLGYVWLRGRFDPACGYRISRTIVIWMGAWLLICMSGWVGPVANAGHAGGLAMGAVWGFLSSGKLSRMVRGA